MIYGDRTFMSGCYKHAVIHTQLQPNYILLSMAEWSRVLRKRRVRARHFLLSRPARHLVRGRSPRVIESWPGIVVAREQAGFDRVHDRLGPVGGAQLLVQPGDVRLGG